MKIKANYIIQNPELFSIISGGSDAAGEEADVGGSRMALATLKMGFFPAFSRSPNSGDPIFG
jgi:hypothetical protein